MLIPLTNISTQTSGAKLLEERDAKRERIAGSGQAFPVLPVEHSRSADEASMLLSTADWSDVLARDVPDAEGRPVVGVDLGGGRAWSAATACYPSGRTEAIAVAPGEIPSLEEQERRDRAPRGIYRHLYQTGRLAVAEGLQVPPVGAACGRHPRPLGKASGDGVRPLPAGRHARRG